MSWQKLLDPDVLVFVIPIVAILTGGAIVIVKRVVTHWERMAMIERGLHPDFPPETDEFADEQDA